MDTLVYVGVLLVIALLIIGIIFVKKKFAVSKEDIELVDLAVELIEYIAKQFPENHYKEGIVTVIGYVTDALEFVIQNYDIDKKSNEEITHIIFTKAKEICIANGLTYDSTLEAILIESVSFIMRKYLV